jgi:hypothetical protein
LNDNLNTLSQISPLEASPRLPSSSSALLGPGAIKSKISEEFRDEDYIKLEKEHGLKFLFLINV